jgi:hypothetical protein
MKKIYFLVFFLGIISCFLFANPQEVLDTCFLWLGKDEISIISAGGKKDGNDVDLRIINLGLIRRYVIENNNTQYFYNLKDGIINGANVGLLSYGNKNSFIQDGNLVRQIVSNFNGKIDSSTEFSGFMIVSYKFYRNGYEVVMAIHTKRDTSNDEYGDITIDIAKI